jgi:tryptophan synthase alpha chain
MSSLASLFQGLKRDGRKAFIPFLPAGDPSPAATVALGVGLADVGAHLIEIGFPYSDPIADGPVIQAAYTRALDRGLRLEDVFSCARQIRDARPAGPPLVGMASFSLIHRRGPAAFLDRAVRAGLSGVIVPDLPLEESDEMVRLAAQRDLSLVQLVTPTTPRERARAIAELSTGFLYCVSVTGITGARSSVPPEIVEQLGWLRTQTDLPLCVGFGISRPEHVCLLRPHADGVIVGSALVRLLEQAADRPMHQLVEQVVALACALQEALGAQP